MDKLQKVVLGAVLAFTLALGSPAVSTADTDKGLSDLLDEVGATQVSDQRASKLRGELYYKRTGHENWTDDKGDKHYVVKFKATGRGPLNHYTNLRIYKNGKKMVGRDGQDYKVHFQDGIYYAMIETTHRWAPWNWRNWHKVTIR